MVENDSCEMHGEGIRLLRSDCRILQGRRKCPTIGPAVELAVAENRSMFQQCVGKGRRLHDG
jgi:hypothetical protein